MPCAKLCPKLRTCHFGYKLSGLISQFRILEKSANIQRTDLYLVFFLKINKIYGAPMKPSELFCFKDTINFTPLFFFFLAAGNRKFQRANATAIAYDANEYPPDDWLKTGWARDLQTRTRLVDSLIYVTCSPENNAFSVLHYVINVALHYYM